MFILMNGMNSLVGNNGMFIKRIENTNRFKAEIDGEEVIFANEDEIMKYWKTKYKFPGYCGFGKSANWPFKQGDEIIIPKGTFIKTTGGRKDGPAGKTYKVKVNHILCGANYSDSGGYVIHNPELRWAGTGGYWHGCDINDILEANGVK